MAIQYNFDNLNDMADFFEHMAQRMRTTEAEARTARDRSAARVEATTFEYAVSVVRQSNLTKARFLLLEDDLMLAAEDLQRARKVLEDTAGELNETIVALDKRAQELRGDQ